MEEFVSTLEEILRIGRTLHGVEEWLDEDELHHLMRAESNVTVAENETTGPHVFSSAASTVRPLEIHMPQLSSVPTTPAATPPRSPAASMHRWI